MYMSEITFTSRIKPVKCSDFSRITASYCRDGYVDYPWKISSSRIGREVYTDYICDCTGCLITDGKKALLMHLFPEHTENHDIEKLFNFINNNFYIPNKNLQAILVGSQLYKSSQDIFEKLEKIFNKFKIPTTILKTGNAPTNLAYKTATDEVIITNKYIDFCLKAGRNNKNSLEKGFQFVKIAECDEI